jgi:hypothetical protein
MEPLIHPPGATLTPASVRQTPPSYPQVAPPFYRPGPVSAPAALSPPAARPSYPTGPALATPDKEKYYAQ